MGEIAVISFPLITEKWQEDVLFKRFEVCRSIYNSMLGKELKKYRKMLKDERYVNSLAVIHDAYKTEDAGEKKMKKASPEYKEATQIQKQLLKEYGFSDFSFKSEAIKESKHFKGLIPSTMASISIGTPMWVAFDKLLFGNGEICHFKKYDSWSSIATDNRSGLRIVTKDNKTTFVMDSKEEYYVLYTSKVGKALKMKLKIDRKDLWLLEMMEKKIHIVRITRKKVRGKYKYYVQLSVTGPSAKRYDKNGNEKHKPADNKLGIYIDTTSLTISDKDKVETIDLNFGNSIEEEIAELSRYMDTSRRLSNPENFNEDGTIKKGIVKNGIRMRLTWSFSKNYLKAKNKKANLQRVQAEQRKLRSNAIANMIIERGTEICINDYPFQYAAMRKKFKDGEETDAKGRNKPKSKAGKTIAENGPAYIVTALDSKLKSKGYPGVIKKELKNIDYSKENYRSFYANELYRMI